MGTIFSVISGKGGSGASSLTALLGYHLAREGKKVLLIDMACGQKNLDLFLGLENVCFNHIFDVLSGASSLEESVYSKDGVDLLPASQMKSFQEIDEDALKSLLVTAREQYDYCFLDYAGGTERNQVSQILLSDEILFCMTQEPASLRGMDRLNAFLTTEHAISAKLILNKWRRLSFDCERAADIETLTDLTGYPVCGILSFSESIWNAVMTGDWLSPELSEVYTEISRIADHILMNTGLSDEEIAELEAVPAASAQMEEAPADTISAKPLKKQSLLERFTGLFSKR